MMMDGGQAITVDDLETACLAAGVCRVFDPGRVELIDPNDTTRRKSEAMCRPLVLGRCRLDPLALTANLVEPESVWLSDDEMPPFTPCETTLAFWDRTRRKILLVRAGDVPAALPFLAAPDWWESFLGMACHNAQAGLQVTSAAWAQATAEIVLPVPGVRLPTQPQDYDAMARPLVVGKRVDPMEKTNWMDSLIKSSSSDLPKALLANAVLALRHANPWVGVLAFDTFNQEAVVRRPPPWDESGPTWQPRPWGPSDDLRAADWLQHIYIQVKPDVAAQAAQIVAEETPFHPVRDYLDALHWDKSHRLDTWLTDYLGVPDTVYTRQVGRRWMISAVARIYQPGCKADSALILEGPQGIKKSTAIKTLAGADWFTDELADLGTKDAALQTAGAWIIEIAELDAMNRSEVSKIKAFMSRTEDRFRPPYGKRIIKQRRQCVFAGTINPEGGGYLKDSTGARRFWPVVCTQVDIPGIEAVRHQLWAEARWEFMRGAKWWLDTPDLLAAAQAEQSARYQSHPWEEPIASFLVGRSKVTVAELLRDAVQIDTSRQNHAAQMTVSRILKGLGWDRRRSSEKGRPWHYVPGVPASDTGGGTVVSLDFPGQSHLSQVSQQE